MDPDQSLASGLPSRGFLLDEVASGKTEYRATAASKSAMNAVEAERVISLARQYIASGLTDIGVVTPFRAQRELLEQLRSSAVRVEPDQAVRAALEQVEVGTIHTFQGGQHKLMLFTAVLVDCALGSILFAHDLGLLTESERDAWIRRLPALPRDQTMVAARSRAMAELREGIEGLTLASKCEALRPAWLLALGYLVQCGVSLSEDIDPLHYEANSAWSSPQGGLIPDPYRATPVGRRVPNTVG